MSELLLSSDVLFTLGLTLRTSAIAVVLHLTLGSAIAFYLARPGCRMRWLADTLVTLPLIFPPIATGFLLLLLLGRFSPIGHQLSEMLGLHLVFSETGIVLAAFVAGLPLMVKPLQSALSSQRLAELKAASATLGVGPGMTLIRITLPLVKGPLLVGTMLALGRSLGEVGITLMLGGNITGRTNTLSLEIYNAVFNSDYQRAMLLCAVLAVISLTLFTGVRRFGGATL
ncbi:molybdate ABC transporter permease subunit [Vreelandella jeotgali]|uniref:molybdate ABC transporter permease subunit n=1 Tax=Vreelandella jeotgali TaxID=553386 RepID=UPI000347ECB7|nr:ABC transporter permease subunit [Halomonas jeotgali]